MNTKTLEYIIAIAEERSISKAAARFYLTQADLSRHLKRVEADFGAKLFTRHAGGVEPTPVGIIFINDARTILHMEENLTQELKAMRHQAQHTIHVMTDEPFYNFFVRTADPRFREMHPDYKLHYETCNASQARAAILGGKADFGVFYSMEPHLTDMEYLVFDATPFYLAFPKDFPGPANADGLRQALKEGYSIFLYPTGTTARLAEEAHLIRFGIYPEKILEGFARNCIEYVSQGGVCGLLPPRFCTPEVRSRLLVGDILFRDYAMIAYSKNITLSPAMQDLMQIIIDSAPR